MANYALDEESKIITAKEALFNKKYHCPECRGALRKRMGQLRQPHFFHLSSAPFCRLYQKGSAHLALQHLLKKENPSLELERSFPDIGRIADLFWAEKKLVFEIQCSPISFQEVRARTHDYGLKGLRVIWLLNDRLYNRRRVRPEEPLLRESGYFFSLKKGLIYDQFELFYGNKRVKTGPLMPVTLNRPKKNFFQGALFDLMERCPEAKRSYEEWKNRPRTQKQRSLFIKKVFFISLEFLLRRIAKK